MLELFIMLLFGGIAGILIGLLPGIPFYLAPFMLFPFIGNLTVEQILVFWLACQIGSQYFSSVAAILMKIPGESSSLVYINDIPKLSIADRYKLVRQTAWGSTVGSVISLSILMMLFYFGLGAKLISLTNTDVKLTVLIVLIFFLIWFTGHKKLSLLLFSIGAFLTPKENYDLPNWVFDMQNYTTDITNLLLIMTLILIPEFLNEIKNKEYNRELDLTQNIKKEKLDLRSMLRGSWIGSLTGLIPGPSSILSTMMAYSSYPANKIKEKIISAETANNSSAITSMLPFLYIGLPITLSEMILFDMFQVKTFHLPMDLISPWKLFPSINILEFCFIIIAIYILVFHILAQRFLRAYEQLLKLAHGKLMWIYILLVGYIFYIDISFNPVVLWRYFLFFAMLLWIGIKLKDKNINMLPLIFGFLLGDMLSWTVYHFYMLHF